MCVCSCVLPHLCGREGVKRAIQCACAVVGYVFCGRCLLSAGRWRSTRRVVIGAHSQGARVWISQAAGVLRWCLGVPIGSATTNGSCLRRRPCERGWLFPCSRRAVYLRHNGWVGQPWFADLAVLLWSTRCLQAYYAASSMPCGAVDMPLCVVTKLHVLPAVPRCGTGPRMPSCGCKRSLWSFAMVVRR